MEQGKFRTQRADDTITPCQRLRDGFTISRIALNDVSPGGYPTALASETRQRLGKEWYRLLRGIENDPVKIDLLIETLRRIESELVSRRRREGTRSFAQE